VLHVRGTIEKHLRKFDTARRVLVGHMWIIPQRFPYRSV
jgi:hypothetical protein